MKLEEYYKYCLKSIKNIIKDEPKNNYQYETLFMMIEDYIKQAKFAKEGTL
ncbi:MAG: hypothetical protein J6T10_26565 [Methanobrevibacter sp.]|nr:hypothetical protein [Methanobrevibacter sp.]